MSIARKVILMLSAASILLIPALAEDNYSVNLSSDKFLGNYLVNQSGFTLYYFSGDSNENGASTCYDDCASKWPPFYVDTLILPDSLRAPDFASITRTDGSNQTTFKGWPLYLSSWDRDPEDAFGKGKEDNSWHVVDPQNQPQLF